MHNYFEPRSIFLHFMIDANRINARQADPHMNQIEAWRERDVVEVIMSEVAYKEARAGGNAVRARKVGLQIFSLTKATTPREQEDLRQIERLLFPGGATTPNERNDVEIVFNAKKYGRILVTSDGGSKRQPGGVLGNRGALAEIGVRVMTAAEAVALAKKKIRERDARARRISSEDGTPLPDWVGQD
jgi:hypothetical protein